jgi:succinate dehydrogenase/fumarate reductase flavoprotein subunit
MRSGLRALSEIARFDEEAEVVVVGLGCAGAAAAIEAARAGARTLVLERASGGGGTSALSGGVLYLGGGTRLQRACGFEDTPEEMFRYLLASVGDAPDEAKLRLYCEGSVAHYDWLVAQGVPFRRPSTSASRASRRRTTAWSGPAPSAAGRSASWRGPRRVAMCRSTRTRPATC